MATTNCLSVVSQMTQRPTWLASGAGHQLFTNTIIVRCWASREREREDWIDRRRVCYNRPVEEKGVESWRQESSSCIDIYTFSSSSSSHFLSQPHSMHSSPQILQVQGRITLETSALTGGRRRIIKYGKRRQIKIDKNREADGANNGRQHRSVRVAHRLFLVARYYV